jgi:CHAT domain-containing protein
MSDQASRHPTVETMTAFSEGTLSRPELAIVTQHLAACEDCRVMVSETAQFEREEEHRRTNERRIPLKWWGVAAAAAGILIISLALTKGFGREQSPVAILLDAAPREHRTVEPRLAGFPWARLQAPQLGKVAPDPANLKLGGAAGTVLEKTAGQTGPAARHGAGLASLFIGRSSDAIAALEQAAGQSNKASTWNDLAAARYVAAITDERAAQLPLALVAADRALRLDPRSPEALFNRALILEHMELRDQARAAWQKYLAVDSATEWAVEAREHMRRLDERSEGSDFPTALQRAVGNPRAIDDLVRTFPRESHAWVEGPLLAEWADADHAGDRVRANERLELARSLAEGLVRISGEGFAADAVAAIDRSSGQSRTALIDGHRLFRAARIDYSQRRPAHDQFRAAEVLFRRGGSSMGDMASYYAASTLIDNNEVLAAHDALRAIATRLPDRYRALAAQLRWELALCASIAGDWGSALREADAASAVFTTLGEQTNVAAVDGLAAYALERMGATDLAWSRRIRAIAALRGDAHRIRRATILHAAALGLEATDRIAAAEAVMDLVLEERDNPNVNLRTLALADRARLASRTGNAALARSSLDQARATAARLEDAGPREMAVASIDLGEAVLLGRSNPRASLPAFDRTIAYFTERRADALLAEAYLQRARARKAAGDERAAASDYAAALQEVGRQRRSARDGDLRIAFVDTAEQIAEESIELHLTRRDVAAALDVAERLPALLRPDSARVAPREPLPSGVAAIRYVLLREQLAIFCVSSDGIVAKSVRVDRHHLALLVAQFADRVRRRASLRDIQSDGASLYAVLIAPLEGLLAGKNEIVVIPDRELHIVPFAALYDERRQQYLIDRYTIRIAPSVAGASPIVWRELTPAMVIADPATPLGPRLPASRREAEQIAAMHGATLIRGEEATVAQFTESAGRSALVHYTGHADSDFREAYGALLLSPAGQDRGILGSIEIARLALPHHPLVVLAACGTARGEAVHIAGMSSLARAFLDAGARAVVGTLWEIDDDVAGPLFLRIHERLRDGTSPARAVREAQTAMLQSTDERLAHPATWAAVAVISNSEQP